MRRFDAKDFFSIQEKKVSTLIVAFLFFCGLGAYLAITGETRDLPPNLVNVIIALITAIAGVNAVESWASKGGGDSENNREKPEI
jgi:hypothetical protein